MPRTRHARHGSMQFWPRKRARRQYPRVRCWASKKEAAILGFAGYKVGMTHIMHLDNRKNSKTKGQEISCPVTIVECPPIKIISVRFYKDTGYYGLKVVKDILLSSNKELDRKLSMPDKIDSSGLDKMNPAEYADIKAVVCTQPKLTGIGKKMPEVFEMGLGGNNKEKLDYIKNNIGKEIKVTDILKEGQLVDIHAVTKGKGFQGPVKRFGVMIRQHKAEKTKRGPGSLGGWRGQGHIMYRIAHAGQMGYQTRTEYNKWIMKIGHDQKEIEKINKKGGFHRYGLVRNPYLLIKGSVTGPAKRMVRLNLTVRGNPKVPKDAPQIQSIMLNK